MKVFALMIAACFGATLTAHAEVTTLTYQGEMMTGTSQSLLNGATGPLGNLPLTNEPFTGHITGTLTVSGNPNSADLMLVSYSFSLLGRDGADIGLYGGPAPLGTFESPPNSFCGDGCIDLTLLDYSFAGATVDLTNDAYHAPYLHFVISPSGDSVLYLGVPAPGAAGCQNEPVTANPDGGFTYTGSAIADCTVQASNSDPGRWTVETAQKAPELDPSLALAGLTLLFGGLAIIRGRRV